jgi:hypothetical protein
LGGQEFRISPTSGTYFIVSIEGLSLPASTPDTSLVDLPRDTHPAVTLQRTRPRAPKEPARSRRPRLRGPTLSQIWVVLAVALPAIVLLGLNLSAVDLAYHIRAGDEMMRTHHIIRTDTFSFTAFGKPWLDQQWGAQVLLTLLYRVGGWSSLVFFRAAAGAVALLLVYLASRARGASMKQAAGLSLAAGAVALAGIMPRPQIFGILLFAFTVWILASRDRRPGLLYAIPAIAALWANLHGSFFLAPLLAGLALLDDLRRRSPLVPRTSLITLLSLLSPALNPFGLRVWTYAAGISTNSVIAQTITEWRPPSIRDLVGALFFGSVMAAVALVARSPRRLPWTSLLSMAAFFVIGLFAVRGVYWWALAVPPLIVDALPRREDSRAAIGNPLLNTGIVVVVAILAIAFLPWWRAAGSGASGAGIGDAPTNLTAALRRQLPPNERLFNPQPLGSWLELALPRDRVFVDSRIEVYPPSVWDQYRAVSLGRSDWESILDRWKVDAVIASRRDQAWLIPRIRRDQRWAQIFSDLEYVAFKRVQ